ncbi:glycoside hydrolase domain-containing protein, partial [uncultured Muribaculum sp.]
YCGDEDNGQTSAWYVFSALGFYPVAPGTGEYALGSPLFKKAVLHFENGKSMTIDAPDNSDKNVYVDDLTLNGKKHDRNFITMKELFDGGVMDFDMGPTPNKTRGTLQSAAPYSFSKEPAKK